MRWLGLHSVRQRVDRLATQSGLVGSDGPILISWVFEFPLCPSCGYDLDDHAKSAALAEAQAAGRCGFVWVYELTTCPSCGWAEA